MPPIRPKSSQKSANQEGKSLLVLDNIKNGCVKSIRAAASLYTIPLTPLHARATGGILRVDSRLISYKLTQLEGILRGAAPMPATVREIANILLTARDGNPPPTVGKNWPWTFVQRRDELQSHFSRQYDY